MCEVGNGAGSESVGETVSFSTSITISSYQRGLLPSRGCCQSEEVLPMWVSRAGRSEMERSKSLRSPSNSQSPSISRKEQSSVGKSWQRGLWSVESQHHWVENSVELRDRCLIPGTLCSSCVSDQNLVPRNGCVKPCFVNPRSYLHFQQGKQNMISVTGDISSLGD